MRKLPKDRVYDMLEKTNKVEAEKTELSAQKIELANIKWLSTAMADASGLTGELSRKTKQIENAVKSLQTIMRGYDDSVEALREVIFAGLDDGVKQFAQKAKGMGIDPNDIREYKEAIADSKRLKKILRVYAMKGRDVNDVLKVLRKL